MKTIPGPFLTAHWRNLVMLNYEVDPRVLTPFIPSGTELDEWNGMNFVSMVGFQFMDTRVMGLTIPFHANFEEVNLRFYVRRKVDNEWRRGVVFIKELVPRWAIAWVARTFYNENYIAVPMSHSIERGTDGWLRKASYGWTFRGRQSYMEVSVEGQPAEIGAGTHEEFITEHYWGYARQPDNSVVQYQVEHPRWRVWNAVAHSFVCDVDSLYGSAFVGFLNANPFSAFLADGSAVTVFQGQRL